MPTNPAEQYTTTQLGEILTGQTEVQDPPTAAQIGAELLYRTIPDTYSVAELRGGTRPTHQPLNP